jgi:histidinol-phosphate/aromatic aminotransferase/cobyric acid decarboxylase-like protein
MTPFRAITSVYSYYLPEIRDLVTRLTRDYPHDVFLRSIDPGLDDFHHPIIDKLVAAHREDVPGLAAFPHRYPTAGSEEGIREYLTKLQSQGVDRIYAWKGEYEGYREVARTRGIATFEVDDDHDPAALEPGHWFLSNPSARDGMIIPAERIAAIAEAGHQIFYDLSYLDATDPAVFAVGHPNVAAVAFSFSKPFGLFYYRIGFTFAREPIPSLVANKWFKNVFGLLVADRLLDEIDRRRLTARYKVIQAQIVSRLNQAFALGLLISDAFLLARLPEAAEESLTSEQRKLIQRFRRNRRHRFCLTPYFEEHERQSPPPET